MLFFCLKIVYIWIRKVREYTMKNMLNRLKEKLAGLKLGAFLV